MAVETKQGVAIAAVREAFNLHNPESGRLDANKARKLFDLSQQRIAVLLGEAPQTLDKAPDASSLQAGLILFDRIASALFSLVGSREGLRIWMNAGNAQLDGKTPTELLLEGHGEAVADLLEAMLAGQPG